MRRMYLTYFRYFWRKNAVMLAYFWFNASLAALYIEAFRLGFIWPEVFHEIFMAVTVTLTLPIADMLIFEWPTCRRTLR
jgi:hypothetical protein